MLSKHYPSSLLIQKTRRAFSASLHNPSPVDLVVPSGQGKKSIWDRQSAISSWSAVAAGFPGPGSVVALNSWLAWCCAWQILHVRQDQLRINWCGSCAVCYICCSPVLSGRWWFILGPLLWATVHRCVEWWAQRCHPAFVGVTLYSDSEMLPGFCNLAAKEWFRLALFFLGIKLKQVPALFHWWCEIKPVIRLFFFFFFQCCCGTTWVGMHISSGFMLWYFHPLAHMKCLWM